MRRFAALAALLFLLCSCATDVDYAAIRSPNTIASSRVANLQRGTFTEPVRIAIAPPLRGNGNFRREDRASWSKEERAVIDRWVEAAAKKGAIRDAIYLPRLLVENGTASTDPLGEAAKAARLGGAEAVLVVQTAAGTNKGGNVLSVLYLTIVGCWVIPGTTMRSSAIAEGVLIGADGATLYGFGEGLGKKSSVTPVAYADNADGDERAVCEALDELGKRLLEMTGK